VVDGLWQSAVSVAVVEDLAIVGITRYVSAPLGLTLSLLRRGILAGFIVVISHMNRSQVHYNLVGQRFAFHA